ncbi:transporter GOS1 [Microthyrium microscopicum]|uniref:Golgi SNAP receptor complex member 1 n=1 Tax=Microthyrium microscopicum TaxID=703497 RepID=A0A6A6UAF3_9PEZI|nr:transporter GOS1 [Microthyrium microscopicum]
MASSNTGGWAQLRQQTRNAEQSTESLFHTYSQYTASGTLSTKPSDAETHTEAQIRDLLDRRESLITQLSNLLDSESALTASALKQNNLARHREVLTEHRREVARIKLNISEARNRANLMNNVRSDISAYHAANPAQQEADYMLGERQRIDSSNRMMDGVLSQAYDINDNFNTQRETLASVNRRIMGAAAQLPGINTLMNRISSKKRRDAIILAVFIAMGFLLLLYFR